MCVSLKRNGYGFRGSWMKFYDVYYTDESGEILKKTFYCKDKSQARRLFYQYEIKGKLLNVLLNND